MNSRIDAFIDQMVDDFNSYVRGQLSVDELLLWPRAALNFCDVVRATHAYLDLPDDIILRSAMRRRNYPADSAPATFSLCHTAPARSNGPWIVAIRLTANARKQAMRRPQFSLKFLFFVTTVVATVLAVWIGHVHRIGRQRHFVVAIESLGGGEVGYSYQFDADGEWISSAVPPGPAWLRRWVGDDYFTSIYYATVPVITHKQISIFDDVAGLRGLAILSSHGVTDKDILQLSRLKRLKHLAVLGSFSANGLEALTALKDLRRLRVSDNNFTQAEKDRLGRLMPQCEIIYEPVGSWPSNFQVNRNHYPAPLLPNSPLKRVDVLDRR